MTTLYHLAAGLFVALLTALAVLALTLPDLAAVPW